MPDLWARVDDLDEATQRRLADVLETRGADPGQRELRRQFLSSLAIPDGSSLLDVGCGTGVLTRVLASLPGAGTVVGVDAAPFLLDRARELAESAPNVRFQQADARALPFRDGSFDVVIFDSTLSHVPQPERALAEAARVLRPGGRLGAFDGDYATTTVALAPQDPVQVCVEMMMDNSVTDRRVMRRVPMLVRDCGLELQRTRSHGFLETGDCGYMLTVIERGAEMLAAAGTIGEPLALALKTEARRRVDAGTFFGFIAYMSVFARRSP